ncbi:flagellar cap protein FliD N-terminal domain-containing protein, partial [Spirochaetota bacterium]
MPSPYIDLSDEGKYKKYIDKLVEAESMSLTNMVREKDELKKINGLWQKLRNELRTLDTYAGRLYGYESVFRMYKGISDEPDYVTVVPERNAKLGTYTIIPKQTAAPHKISSRPINIEEKLPASDVLLEVNGQEITISFKGGGIEAFARKIEKAQKTPVIKSMVVKKDSKNKVLVLETVETGSDNKITIQKDTGKLLQLIDLFGIKKIKPIYPLAIKPELLEKRGECIVGKDSLQLKPQSRVTIGSIENIILGDEGEISFAVLWKPTAEELADAGGAEKGPDKLTLNGQMELENLDSLKFEDIIIDSLPSYSFPSLIMAKETPEGEEVTAEQKEYIDDELATFYFNGFSHTISAGTNFYTNKSGKAEFTITREQIAGGRAGKDDMPEDIPPKLTVNKIEFKNNNTHRLIEIRDFVYKPTQKEKGLVAKNELERPRDALITYEGVDIIHKNNTIDDVIDGVTI